MSNINNSTPIERCAFAQLTIEKLKNMEHKQQIYAERLIHEILYKGSMGDLTPAHKLMNGVDYSNKEDLDLTGNVLILKKTPSSWLLMKCNMIDNSKKT